MAIKYYVVWKGRNPGIYSDWERCKSQVDGFPGARFKSFTSRAEAESALKGVGTSSAMPLGGKVGLTQPAATGPGSTSSAGTAKKTAGPSSKSPRTWTAAEVTAAAIEVKIFTDGGCEPNPGKSGSGLALYRNNVLAELWYGLHSPHGTNNTAELNAFHRGLIIAKAEADKLKTVGNFLRLQVCDSMHHSMGRGLEKEGMGKARWRDQESGAYPADILPALDFARPGAGHARQRACRSGRQ